MWRKGLLKRSRWRSLSKKLNHLLPRLRLLQPKRKQPPMRPVPLPRLPWLPRLLPTLRLSAWQTKPLQNPPTLPLPLEKRLSPLLKTL